MKRLLLIVLPSLLIVGCSKPINQETLIDKDGLKYHPETKELYSGKVLKNHKGGEKYLEGSYKDGKLDGLLIYWYESGQKKDERYFKDGQLDGLVTTWNESGQKSYEQTFEDGNQDGLQTFWYDNGQKKGEFNFKDGKRDGLWTWWNENGQKTEEKNYKNGKSSSDSYTNKKKKTKSNNGKYVYDSTDGTLTVTISGSSWQGKTAIKTGFGSAYDNQQAQYSRGIVNGNDLYDESGYIKVGYVSGNSVSMDGHSLYKE
jgi:antitoxin component YwqK of YwqJK toxin-antitoxin module